MVLFHLPALLVFQRNASAFWKVEYGTQSEAESPAPWLPHLQGDVGLQAGLGVGLQMGLGAGLPPTVPNSPLQVAQPRSPSPPCVLVRNENSYTGDQLFLQQAKIEAGKPFSCTVTHPWDTAAISVVLCPPWGSQRIAPHMGCVAQGGHALSPPGPTALL